METPKRQLSGKKIRSAYPFYENIIVFSKEGKKYFFNPQKLLPLFKLATFKVEKKRTRSWLTVKEPSTKVEKDLKLIRCLKSLLASIEVDNLDVDGIKEALEEEIAYQMQPSKKEGR